MKKIALFSITLIGFGSVAGLTSCKKCLECKTTYTGSSGGQTTTSNIICRGEEETNKAFNRRIEGEEEDGNTECGAID